MRACVKDSDAVVCCLIGWGELVATLHRHPRDGRMTGSRFLVLWAGAAELGLFGWLTRLGPSASVARVGAKN